MPVASRTFLAAAAGLAFRARAPLAFASKQCGSRNKDPYTSEPNPFGWPLTPAQWLFDEQECWAEQYPMCGGSGQAPMDIDLANTDASCAVDAGNDGPLSEVAHYRIASGSPRLAISPYMRAIHLSADLGYVELKDSSGKSGRYRATDLYVTAPSIHSVNGSKAAAEMLVVHKAEDAAGRVAGPHAQTVMVSMLFDEVDGAHSALFDEMGIEGAGNALPHAWTAPHSLDIPGALSSSLRGPVYAYSGSTPVPPCSEGVTYLVLGARQGVARAQADQLRNMITMHAGGSLKRHPVPRMAEGKCRMLRTGHASLVQAAADVCGSIETDEQPPTCALKGCKYRPANVVAQDRGGVQPASDMMHYEKASPATISRTSTAVEVKGAFGYLMLNGRKYMADKMYLRPIAHNTFQGSVHAGELVIEHVLFGAGARASGDGRLLSAAGGHESSGHTQEAPASQGASHDDHDSQSAAPQQSAGGRVMLSVPLRVGSESPLLRDLGLIEHKATIREGTQYEARSPVDLGAALQGVAAGRWYWYEDGPGGSAACSSHGFDWMLMEETLEVSIEQLNALSVPFSGMDVAPVPVDAQLVARWLPRDAAQQPAACKSPIDLSTGQLGETGTDRLLPRLSWKPLSGLRVENHDGVLRMHSAQLGYARMTGASGFPDFYQVTEVVLRTPSEHLVNGKQFPLELQVLHKKQKTVLDFDDNHTLITSIFYEVGAESKLVEQLVTDGLPEPGKHSTVNQPIDLQWALGPALDGSFHKYDGTNTLLDNCADGTAVWVLLETPMTLGQAQLTKLRAVASQGNNHPIVDSANVIAMKNSFQEKPVVDHQFFLNREMGRDKRDTPIGYALFPIFGTILLCVTVMTATFQREDRGRRAQASGGVTLAASATTGSPRA